VVIGAQAIHAVLDFLAFWTRAWWAGVVISLPNLGIAGLGLSFFAVLVRYLEERLKKLSHEDAVRSGKQYFVDKIRTPLFAFLGFLVLCGFALGPYRVYAQSQAEVNRLKDNLKAVTAERDSAQTALDGRKNNLRSGDVAFDNMLQTFRAFLLFRMSLGAGTTCQITVTAPDETHAIASVVAQLASVASRCLVLGPDFLKLATPEAERQAKNGMTEGAVILHMPKSFKNEVAINDALRGILRLKRVYDLPAGTPQNAIWLQFGTGQQWNNEGQSPKQRVSAGRVPAV
jgi:hypothetical protein